MEWRDLVGTQPRDIRKALEREGMKGRYATITLSLAIAETDVLKEINGDYIGVASITGDGTCKVRLDHRHAQELDLRQVSEISSPFGKIYFTTDGAGGEVVLLIGGALTARIKPIQSKVSVRSIAGTDVDLLQESEYTKRNVSHTYKHKEETTQTAAGTREKLMGASTPVKWAIVNFQTVARVGDVNTTIDAGAHPGQKYPANSYMTVEYCDLNDIYIIDAAGVAVIYTITYTEEA